MKRCAGCGDPCGGRYCDDCMVGGEPEAAGLKPALPPRPKLPANPRHRAETARDILPEAVLELCALWDRSPGYTEVAVLSQLAFVRRLAEHATETAK